MKQSIMKLFESAFASTGENYYLVKKTEPGYSNFFLSMVKCLRNYITMKQFDISDPDCQEDDQILSWCYQFIQSLGTTNQNSLDLRSKASK